MSILEKTHSCINHILEAETKDMPLPQRFAVRALQILYASLRDLADGQLSLQAMSLVYTTLITLVPLLAISFSVLKGFGVHNQIEPFLLNFLQGLGPDKSAEVTQRVIGFVDNIKVGVLGAVGLALLIYAVIALMQKIEAAFNYIWRVGQDRTLAQRFSDYLSVLLMGPLLIFLSAGITGTARHSEFIQNLIAHSAMGTVLEIASLFIPWLVMALGMSFVYIYMPNTKVKITAAFAGASVTALLWKVMSFIFSSFIASSANYVAIYAAFATLIVLMIWLYATWLIVLVGANVGFYVQYPRYLRVSREALILTPHLIMKLGLNALSLIAKAHYNGGTPVTIDVLSQKLKAPILAVQNVMALLESGGIVTTSSAKAEQPYYLPACPFDKTPLQKAIDALEQEGGKGWINAQKMHSENEADTIMDLMDKARKKAITNKTLKQVLLG